MTSRAHPQPQCGLLQLHPELRNMIYEFVLYVPTLTGDVRLVKGQRQSNQPPSVLALIQTCRQVQDEAEGIFYSINSIAIHFSAAHHSGSDRNLEAFVRATSKVRLASILALKIEGGIVPEALIRALRVIKPMVSLKKLHVQLNQRYLERNWSRSHLEKPGHKAALKKIKALERIELTLLPLPVSHGSYHASFPAFSKARREVENLERELQAVITKRMEADIAASEM